MSLPIRSRYFVRPQDVPPYHPANHTGTVNRRLIGAGNVGAASVEVVLGVIEKGKGALPHSHSGIEQVCYLLEGRARAEVGGGLLVDVPNLLIGQLQEFIRAGFERIGRECLKRIAELITLGRAGPGREQPPGGKARYQRPDDDDG